LLKELGRTVLPDQWHVLALFLRYSRVNFISHSADLGTPEWFATNLEYLRSGIGGTSQPPVANSGTSDTLSWWDRLVRRVTHKPAVQNESPPTFESWYKSFLSGTSQRDLDEDE